MFVKRLLKKGSLDRRESKRSQSPSPSPRPVPVAVPDPGSGSGPGPNSDDDSMAPPVPSGNLKASQLNPQIAVHDGVPRTASILAYEPVQRLLAVSTSDGRTKILGAAGVEGLLQSPTQYPCKFLEFVNNRGLLVHVNTQNDVEVWDVEKRELAYFQKWEGEITSFNVLQGSSFMFVGDHSGAVFVLQYEDEEQQLNMMPYVIPAHVTLGGLVRVGSTDAPSVIGVLPQPDVFFTRLLVAYGNGLIILWGLHETQVLAVRGGTEDQRLQLSNYVASRRGRAISSPLYPEADDVEDKEICSVCWACPIGSLLATGYVDGEIFLWSFPTISKGSGQMEAEFVEGPMYSGEPAHRLDLAPGKAKMPVVGLTWGASAISRMGIGGRLYVFGGGEVGQPEVLTVLSLDDLNGHMKGEKLLQWELALQGPFADVALLPVPGGTLGTPAAALGLLMMPGLLHIYDERSIANYFAALAEGTPSPSLPQPVPLQLPVTETKVTCAKLVLVSNDGVAAKVLLQLPYDKTSLVPSTLPAGTKWPISGGAFPATSSQWSGEENLYITGHEDGCVKFWDASSRTYGLVCTVENQSKMASGDQSSVSAFEFCVSSGLLAVGHENGMVFTYKIEKEVGEVKCYTVSVPPSNAEEELLKCDPGFCCILTQNVHKAAIRTISVASGLFRLAVGDDDGMVSLVDLQSHRITFYNRCFPHHPGPILSVTFSSEPLSSDGTPVMLSPHTSPSDSKHNPTPMSVDHVAIVYVVGKDANMVAIDGSTGVIFGAGAMQPKNPSSALSLHLLDGGGAPFTNLKLLPDEILEAGSPKDPADLSISAASSVHNESPSSTPHEDESSDLPGLGATSEALFLLLCCTDSLRLYATSSVLQGLSSTLRKVKLEKTCCWASTFCLRGRREAGLILMFSTGELEVRSLPDLGLVKDFSFSPLLNWKIEPNIYFPRTMASNINGQLVVIDPDGELIHISLCEDDVARDEVPLSRLYDRDLARAADAAITYARDVSKRKSQTPIQGMQGLLGGVLKELKNVLDIDQHHVIHDASELPKLFTSRPFIVIPSEPTTPSHQEASGSVESPRDSGLDIDDIDVESTDPEPVPSPPVETSRGNKFTDRLSGAIKSLKGKERSNEAESNRMKLFDGKNEAKPSKAQTADDIRAKYGHPRKSQEARELSSVMGMAREKLAERGEKLQDISDKTAQLEDNAENFASMAEELAKRMSQKKWWEF